MDSRGLLASGYGSGLRLGKGWGFWFQEMDDDAPGGKDPFLSILSPLHPAQREPGSGSNPIRYLLNE